MTRPTIIFLLSCMGASIGVSVSADSRLTVPAGFTITRLPFDVPNARQMALTEQGLLLVGTRRHGTVWAIPDALSDKPGPVVAVLSDLSMPSGLAVADGDLYIGAKNEVIRVRDIDTSYPQAAPEYVTRSLPDKRHHGWKYLGFGPDGRLYLPVGAPCNICLSDDPRFATMLRMDPKSGETEIFAHGIRNSVGFDWHPQTGELWFTDNGRDMMGDDVPAEELNVAPRPGLHFGYPFLHAADVRDPEFGEHAAAQGLSFTPPAVEIQAHSAAIGMTFYAHDAFPARYTNAIFIAEHGSWNRSSKVGYQISVVTEEEDGALAYEPFVTGWLEDQDAWGRPSDVLVTPDGSLLIADDTANAIYQVRYSGAD